jgi:hypothetical protein
MRDLAAAGRLSAIFDVTGVGPTVDGRNGGGDRYFTDGDVAVGVLVPEGGAAVERVEVRGDPTPVVVKDQLWTWLRPVLGGDASLPRPVDGVR